MLLKHGINQVDIYLRDLLMRGTVCTGRWMMNDTGLWCWVARMYIAKIPSRPLSGLDGYVLNDFRETDDSEIRAFRLSMVMAVSHDNDF